MCTITSTAEPEHYFLSTQMCFLDWITTELVVTDDDLPGHIWYGTPKPLYILSSPSPPPLLSSPSPPPSSPLPLLFPLLPPLACNLSGPHSNLYWRKILYENYLALPTSSGGFGGDIGDAFCQLFAALVKTCRPIPCICICSRKGGPGDWSNGIQLLQVS